MAQKPHSKNFILNSESVKTLLDYLSVHLSWPKVKVYCCTVRIKAKAKTTKEIQPQAPG